MVTSSLKMQLLVEIGQLAYEAKVLRGMVQGIEVLVAIKMAALPYNRVAYLASMN
jgi:hypothetical protein